MHELIDPAINFLVTFISNIGYLGIFIGMFLESTAFPLPSELVVIPAGIAASQGQMNLLLIIFVGTLGNVLGAIFSYYLAKSLGRAVLLKIGKYLFVKPETIIKVEEYFKSHGSISVFVARLLPGLRHFISLPAGIAGMNFRLFCFYTTLGSLIWTIVLAMLGYEIGENRALIKEYIHIIIMCCAATCALIIPCYYFFKKRKKVISKV
ncbi:MAG: DedA family protein [Proteobacteria bacterium]|nr:DedA family protein [Pseudomonadota bacterium]